jgi:hypothetical protein
MTYVFVKFRLILNFIYSGHSGGPPGPARKMTGPTRSGRSNNFPGTELFRSVRSSVIFSVLDRGSVQDYDRTFGRPGPTPDRPGPSHPWKEYPLSIERRLSNSLRDHLCWETRSQAHHLSRLAALAYLHGLVKGLSRNVLFLRYLVRAIHPSNFSPFFHNVSPPLLPVIIANLLFNAIERYVLVHPCEQKSFTFIDYFLPQILRCQSSFI